MNYGLQNRTLSHVEARYQISSWYSARRYQRKKTAHQSRNTLPRLTSEYLACIAGILIEVGVTERCGEPQYVCQEFLKYI